MNRDFIYTLKLNGFYGWENIISITGQNNRLHYSVGTSSSSLWKTITTPEGIWNFKDINSKIRSILEQNGDSPDDIIIAVDKNEYKNKSKP